MRKGARGMKQGIGKRERRRYLLRRFCVETFLFSILFLLAAAPSFSAGDVGISVLLAAAVSCAEIWCERSALRRSGAAIPQADVRKTWRKDLLPLLGAWAFFAAVFYFLRGRPPLSADFLIRTAAGSAAAAVAALYLRRTRVKLP